MRKYLEIGGMIAAVVLVAFGVAAIVLGLNGVNEVNSSLKQQKITGTPNMTPAVETASAQKAGLNPATLNMPSCSVVGKAVTDGTDARCFANYMRVDALIATGGLYFSQMPHYATANGKGTNVEAEALKKEGKPVENPARQVWVEGTALSTALNASDIAEQTAIFGIVVGIALLLAGVGFGVLTGAGALRNREAALRLPHRERAVATGESSSLAT
jgi:F0F1-type ATP synthase membrane subunit c/vacuolar-type H+-ATPase subunit K